MKKYLYLGATALAAIVISCATNPVTGKKEFNFVSNSSLFPTAFAQYDQFLKENKVVTGTAASKQVETIGIKIKNAAERYFASLGEGDALKDYRWEYKLVEDKAVNAWCMPGGKIVVYTGILPITKDDAGLATVMGHEVAHALMNHGAKRMSVGQVQELVGMGVGLATSKKSEQTQALFQQAYGVGSNVLVALPFSRAHETEADKVGLTLMAIAGFNPEEAVNFWSRMSSASGGGAPMEILSTHPSDATRIANLKRLIPEAKANAAKLGVKFK